MAYGIIGYSQQNAPWQPSGSIWGDCSSQELIDEGSGFFDHRDFKTRLPATADGASVAWAIDSGSFSYNTSFDSVLSITTGATSQDDAGLATRPLGPLGQGQKVWVEANISLASIAAAKGVFVGLVNAAALGSKLLISAASATKNSNTLGTTSGGQSVVGFWLHGDAVTNFDAVYCNNTQVALTPSTIKTVLASVLTANANNPNPANLAYTPPLPPGALIATTGNQASLVNGTAGFVKLGVRWDGQQYVYWYVNGAQVAKAVVDSTFDVTSSLAGVVQIMAGTAATNVLNVSFLRSAAQLVL